MIELFTTLWQLLLSIVFVIWNNDALLGAIMPVIVAVVIQSAWPKGYKAIVVSLICIVTGLLKAYLSGFIDPENIATSILVILTISQATYLTFWKHTGIAPWLEKVTDVDHMIDKVIPQDGS